MFSCTMVYILPFVETVQTFCLALHILLFPYPHVACVRKKSCSEGATGQDGGYRVKGWKWHEKVAIIVL
jgi:hypothetical protein